MNTLPVMQSLTMTSREIAELTGKRHDNVLRDIRDMLTQIYDLQDNSCLSYLPIQGVSFDMCPQTKRITMYRLDKDHTITLLIGYDAKARFKVVKRWRELEEQAAAQANKVAAATTWDQQRQAGKAEIVASQRMDANEDQGNSPCYKTCKSSGEAVVGLLVKKLN